MTTAQAYAEVERLHAPSLAFGSVAWGRPAVPHAPPSSKSRLAHRAAEIAAKGGEIEGGNLPASPAPSPTARQARWTPFQQ